MERLKGLDERRCGERGGWTSVEEKGVEEKEKGSGLGEGKGSGLEREELGKGGKENVV